MSRRGHFDIPLKRDATGRFLPWIIALMVYLAALALAAAMVLSDLARRWDGDLAGSLTVQVSALSGTAAPSQERRVQDVMAILSSNAAVADARPLPRADALKLVEPWLGEGGLAAELPLPTLIDVRLAPGADMAALEQRLESAVPGTVVEDPARWLGDLRRLARTVQWLSATIVLLIGGVAVAAVIFAASAGFAVHRSEVELLHVMGAADGYVAGQFQNHVLRLTMLGGGAGFLLALLTLWAVGRAGQSIDAALLPDMTLAPAQWLALLAVPAMALLLAALTARVTVLRALGRLP